MATRKFTRPATREALHTWIKRNLQVNIPCRRAIESHSAPFDYLAHAFFEEPGTTPDCIVWASRGGGKTFLGAIATALDLVFKPGIQVRILAGSFEQGQRMHQHLRAIFERPRFRELVKDRITDKRIILKNGSRVEILAQSQASVRGTRPHKLRCDEVELFDPDVWEAAQLTTRSGVCGDVLVRGGVESFSTLHRPNGLMSRLVDEAAGGSRRLFKWGIIDVLARCGTDRACGPCPLREECGGKAKEAEHSPGHMSIDDAIQMKSRVTLPVWRAEMVCDRPSRADCVFPEFDRAVHVVKEEMWDTESTVLIGMDFGFRSPTVILWGVLERGGVLYITDERIESGQLMSEHIDAILSRPRPEWIGADPSGNNTSEQTGHSTVEMLRRAGLAVRSRRLPTMTGIGLIRSRLAPGAARLLVHERCARLIRALETYHYDPSRPFSEEPVKDGPDHACDALRYLVSNLDEWYTCRMERYAG